MNGRRARANRKKIWAEYDERRDVMLRAKERGKAA
jgi:hypothetical protein